MKVGIVGAGVAGLTAAYRLAKKGHEVEVFEASDHVGGLAAGFPIAGTTLERYYHHIFTSDIHIRGLVDELGVRDSLHWLPSQMGLSYQGKLYPFGTPSQILRASPPAPLGKNLVWSSGPLFGFEKRLETFRIHHRLRMAQETHRPCSHEDHLGTPFEG